MSNIRKPLFIKPLDLGAITASAANSGHPVFALNRHKAIGVTWQADATSGLWARGKFDTTQTVNFAAMVAANAQVGTTIQLRLGNTQADVDGSSAPYDSGALTFINPAIMREDDLYHSHLEMASPVAALWWRIDIGGHTGSFEASSLILGQSIEPSRFYNYDWQYGVRDLGTMDFTRYGVLDEEPGVIFRTVEFTLGWVSEAEYEASFRPLVENAGKRGIVYVVFDPQPSSYRQARTFMGVLDKPPFAKGIRKPRTFELDWSIVSMI